jgi:hypothetical protein
VRDLGSNEDQGGESRHDAGDESSATVLSCVVGDVVGRRCRGGRAPIDPLPAAEQKGDDEHPAREQEAI